MTVKKHFVKLDKSLHDRASFDCGNSELNAFLQTQAAKHMDAGISKTLLLPSSHVPLANGKLPIAAFYTVAPSTIKKSNLPVHLAKKLPHYPVPVFLLAQMAVHNEHKGKGIGKITLIQALQYLHRVNEYMPAYAVIVDCINADIEGFYLQYGFKVLCQHNNRTRMFLPMKTIVQLFS